MTENIKLNYTLDKLGIVISDQSPSKHNRAETRRWKYASALSPFSTIFENVNFDVYFWL